VTRAPVPVLAVVLAVAWCVAVAGCGYTWGTTYSQSVRTVAVPVFDNATFVLGIEGDLTDAVGKELQASTPWRITNEANADTTLVGTIRRAETTPLSQVRGAGIVQESAVTLVVDFEWRDNRTGEVILQRRNFQALSTFVPARGEDGQPGERIELGIRGATDELAARIVDELRNSW
jgi:hypothetical protein